MHNLVVAFGLPPSPDEPEQHEPAGAEDALDDHGTLLDRLARMEQMVGAVTRPIRQVEHRAQPAWRCVTRGEPRVAVTIAIAVAVVLQVVLPNRLTLGTRWLLPLLETALLAVLITLNPLRIERSSRPLRVASISLIAAISVANGWAAVRLIRGLIDGTEGQQAGPLLATGAAIWMTNVIVFGLWYWDLDRGGPAAPRLREQQHTDFSSPKCPPRAGTPDWEPQFIDYLYVSFTNATAFSPTDVMPMTQWTKLLMLVQSMISLAIVVARRCPSGQHPGSRSPRPVGAPPVTATLIVTGGRETPGVVPCRATGHLAGLLACRAESWGSRSPSSRRQRHAAWRQRHPPLAAEPFVGAEPLRSPRRWLPP